MRFKPVWKVCLARGIYPPRKKKSQDEPSAQIYKMTTIRSNLRKNDVIRAIKFCIVCKIRAIRAGQQNTVPELSLSLLCRWNLKLFPSILYISRWCSCYNITLHMIHYIWVAVYSVLVGEKKFPTKVVVICINVQGNSQSACAKSDHLEGPQRMSLNKKCSYSRILVRQKNIPYANCKLSKLGHLENIQLKNAIHKCLVHLNLT